MTVREMKMIPDEVGVVGLALLGLRIGVEVCDGHGVGIQSPQRNVFFFRGLYAVCTLLYLLIPSTSLYGLYHFEDELCADLEALAELIAVGEIMQFNVR